MKGYPRWFEPALLATTSFAFTTGCLLVPTTLALRADWSVGWRLSAGARSPMVAAHAALAFFFLIAIGALWSVHMRAGWRRHRQRTSGLMLVLMLLWLGVSGVGVYYLVDESWANAAGITHAAVGLVLAVPFLWHAIVGWRYRRLVRLGLHPH